MSFRIQQLFAPGRSRWLTGWGVLFFVLLPAWCPAETSRNILILHSYHKYPWTDEILDGIHCALDYRQEVCFFTEYMDTKRI
ncbi:MAG: hypothetical protein KAH06_03795, partial [Desulfobacterales bacterium]|nr:hypothetical protein [Desulfobacterales bacterium]